jgi:hypothetical protein
MNIEALIYFHRLRRMGYSHGAARNSTLHLFCPNFQDYAKRTQRYIGIAIYPETMEFGVSDGITFTSEAEAVHAIDQRLRQQKPGLFR